MAETRLVLGTGRSARAGVLDALFAERWGAAMLVLPTRAAADRRREAIMRAQGRGLWDNPVCDFHAFVAGLLAGEGQAPRLVGDTERRRLVEARLRAALATGAWADCRMPEDSPGVARHLAQVITQIKQAAVEPADFEARVAGRADATPMDRLVAAVYAGYQEALKAAGVFDVPGLYWAAEACCRAGRPARLAACDTLIFDGFDDFTPSEFRLIEALRPHVGRIAFGMHHDPDPARRDLFRGAARAVARVRERFDPAVAEAEAPAPATWSAFVADNLFSRDCPAPPPGLAANVALIRCGDAQHEALAIARRAKAAIRDGGVPPSEIAVAHPDPAAALAPMAAAFAACGVPLHPRAGGSLAETPAGAAVARILRALADWEHDAVLDAVTAPPIAPPDASATRAFAYLARHAAVVAGRDAWSRGVEALRRRVGEGRGREIEGLRARLPDAAAALEALSAALDRLGAVADALPASGAPAVHAAALDAALDTMDAARLLPDEAGWRGVRDVLAALRRAPDDAWDRARFAREVSLALREAPGPVPRTPGGVALCAPADLRNQSFAWVFLAGLNEGVFPRQPGVNAIYGEEDRVRLVRAGIPLDNARDRLDRERLVLHHAVAAARDHLVLTHPLLKADQREAAPSPFVADVAALLPGLVPGTESPVDAVAPAPEAAASPADWMNAAFLGGGPARDTAAARFPRAARAAAIETRRHGADPADAHDGALDDPAVVAALAAEHGPDHEFSVRRLEEYAACPFSYFQSHVLGMEDVETPEAEFDPRVRGTILHDTLQAFHTRYRGLAVPEIPPDEADAAMCAILGEVFESAAWRSVAAPPGLRAAERGHLEATLLRHLALMRAGDDAEWKPTHFEAAFGHAKGGTDPELRADEPLIVDTSAGPVRFAGRIDRVDLSDCAARIIDYKSGAVPAAADVHAGRSLQCTVYAWAVEELLLPGRRCLSGLFVQVGRRSGSKIGFDALGGGAVRDKDKWARREETARAAIAAAVAGIRAGRFTPPVDNGHCHGCKGARACRHEEARLQRKADGVARAASLGP